MVYDVEDLMEIEEQLRLKLRDDFEHILAELNRAEELETFCRLIGAEDVLGEQQDTFQSLKNGIILVIGESQVKKNVMQSIVNDLGIQNRLECCLGYADAKRFPYKTLQNNYAYSLVLVGSMGHKAKDIGDNSSPISMMEKEDGYPPVIRLGTNELKITKSNFKEAVKEALRRGYIRAS